MAKLKKLILDQSCQELPVVTHTPSHSLHIPRLTSMHLFNLPLTTLMYVYIDKLLNSLLIVQSVGPHPYLDILFL